MPWGLPSAAFFIAPTRSHFSVLSVQADTLPATQTQISFLVRQYAESVCYWPTLKAQPQIARHKQNTHRHPRSSSKIHSVQPKCLQWLQDDQRESRPILER